MGVPAVVVPEVDKAILNREVPKYDKERLDIHRVIREDGGDQFPTGFMEWESSLILFLYLRTWLAEV